MSERAQALEAALNDFRARLEADSVQLPADAARILRENLWELYEGSPLSAPPVGVSPQPDDSTPDMGHGWFVTVGRWGDSIVTIEEKCLSGKPDFTPEDQALVRGAARHLLAFIGQPASLSPVEPTPPTLPRGFGDHGQHGNGAWSWRVAQPVEPTPEPPHEHPCGYCDGTGGVGALTCPACEGKLAVESAPSTPGTLAEAPPTPAPCVWRVTTDAKVSEGWVSLYATCGGKAKPVIVLDDDELTECCFCGHPLQITR